MSEITIGRFVGTLVSVQRSGDEVRLSGHILVATADERQLGMQNLLGLVDNDDEPVIQVVCATRPDLDGFYEVGSASAVEERGVTTDTGLWRWSASLIRIDNGYANPLVEIAATQADRDDSVFGGSGGDSAPFPTVYVPVSWNDNGTSNDRTAETGEVAIGQPYPPDISVTQGVGLYRASPYDFYEGSCRVEVSADGSWFTTVGRQLPRVNFADEVRITNGLVMLSMDADGLITLLVYNSGGWDDAGTFELALGGVVSTPIGAPMVYRNAPNQCSIGFVMGGSTYTSLVTFALRRGEMAVSGSWGIIAGSVIANYPWAIQANPAVTAARVNHQSSGNYSGAIRRNAPNGDGHRWILGSDNPNAVRDVTDGLLEQTTGDAVPPINFFLGVELDASLAESYNTAISVRNEWWAGVAEHQQVVSP